MKPKTKVLVAVLSVLGVCLALILFLTNPGGGDPGGVPTPEPGGESSTPMVADFPKADGTVDGTQRDRVTDASASANPGLAPEIREALCGFRGRVVDHAGTPLPDYDVQLMRVGVDSIFGGPLRTNAAGAAQGGDEPDLFGTLDINLEAGQTVTGPDGRFRFTGVWPQAMYLLLAGESSGNTAMVIVDQTPGPGEMVDLGDIELALCATVTGTVVDDEGEPVPGALVRAIDIPGAFTAFVPLERIHPENAVIIFEQSVNRVIEFPGWVARTFDKLPIPKTTSGKDGTFRLTGVHAGNNMLAVTAPARQSFVQPQLRLAAGEEKDVGKVRLREGEEVWGRVLDGKDKPIVGAQVLVGQVGAIGPFALAAWTEPTNENGEFSLAGFRGGKIIAAARRQPGDPWVIGDPQPVVRDVTLRLPATFNLTVRVVDAAGQPRANADLRLLPDVEGDDMSVFARVGFFAPADLGDRVEAKAGEELGSYVVRELAGGNYRLEVTAPGYNVAGTDIVMDRDVEQSVTLEPSSSGSVLVVNERNEPVREAAIYSGEEQNGMPTFCGRTDRSGRLRLHRCAAGEINILVQHPAYGGASAKATLPAEDIRLVLKTPGSVRGTLTEDMQPPPLGEYMIVATQRGDNEGTLPRLAAPDPKGNFEVLGIQPGTYHLQAVPSARALRSIGSIFKMMQESLLLAVTSDSTTVEVASDSVAHASINVSTEPEPIEGPSAHVSGTVFLNGRPAKDMVVMTWSSGRRASEVNANGRFDLGQVAAGAMTLHLHDPSNEGAMFSDGLWNNDYTVVADQDLEINIDLNTGEIAGVVLTADREVARRCEVTVYGGSSFDTAGDETPRASTRLSTATDETGKFRFEQVPTGVYHVTAKSGGGRGAARDVRVMAGSTTPEIEVILQRTLSVSGSIDMKAFGAEKPRWVWLAFRAEGMPASDDDDAMASASVDEDDGTFEVRNLFPGRYTVEISAYFPKPGSGKEWDGSSQEYVHSGVILVVGHDLTGVVLHPVKKPEQETKPVTEATAQPGKAK